MDRQLDYQPDMLVKVKSYITKSKTGFYYARIVKVPDGQRKDFEIEWLYYVKDFPPKYRNDWPSQYQFVLSSHLGTCELHHITGLTSPGELRLRPDVIFNHTTKTLEAEHGRLKSFGVGLTDHVKHAFKDLRHQVGDFISTAQLRQLYDTVLEEENDNDDSNGHKDGP